MSQENNKVNNLITPTIDKSCSVDGDDNNRKLRKNSGVICDKSNCCDNNVHCDNIDGNCSNSSSSSISNVLKPGSKIKPEISIKDVENLVQRLYGIVNIEEIKELNSYDDRNFLILNNRNMKNSLINTTNNDDWTHGYVMKILNALESKKLDFVDAQNQMMIFLRENGINCPKPIKNLNGNLYSTEKIINNDTETEHVVRLLQFIPGKILYEVPLSNHLFYDCGEYIAKFDKILKNFHHDAYKTYKSIWQLQSVPMLKEFLYVIDDYGRKLIVEEIIEAFETKVLPHLNVLEKSIIHGDMNEQNIIVKEIIKNDVKEYRIDGVLDFGDTNFGPLIFELAIAMTYMMLLSKDLSTGGLVMAGYTTIRILPNIEKEILKECVAARLCQSLVLGTYSYSFNPNNDYILTTQKAGWELLETLWRDNLDKVDELWKNTSDHYLMQSSK